MTPPIDPDNGKYIISGTCDLCSQMTDSKNPGIVLPCSHKCHLNCFMLYIYSKPITTQKSSTVKNWYLKEDEHSILDVELPENLERFSSSLNELECPLEHEWNNPIKYTQLLGNSNSKTQNPHVQVFDTTFRVKTYLERLNTLRQIIGDNYTYYHQIKHSGSPSQQKDATDWLNSIYSLMQPMRIVSFIKPVSLEQYMSNRSGNITNKRKRGGKTRKRKRKY